MKVTLTPMGGFAAIRRPARTLDTLLLPESVAERLQLLVKAAATVQPGPISERVRDGMAYQIEIDDDGKTSSLVQSDGSMSPQFSALLEFIERNAKP